MFVCGGGGISSNGGIAGKPNRGRRSLGASSLAMVTFNERLGIVVLGCLEGFG